MDEDHSTSSKANSSKEEKTYGSISSNDESQTNFRSDYDKKREKKEISTHSRATVNLENPTELLTKREKCL